VGAELDHLNGTSVANCRPTLLSKGAVVAKYGKKAQKKVEKAMHERKHGTLRSGSGGKVTSRKQAIAIGLSEAREAGGKVPKKKSSSSRKKSSSSRKTSSSSRKKSSSRSTKKR
jgi:hypothetical protein